MKGLWFVLLILTWAAPTAFGATPSVLAKVGQATISTEDFKKRMQEILKDAQNPPTPDQFLEDLIRYEVGVQEAERLKLQNDPRVKERFRQVLYNAVLEKQLGPQISKIKVSEQELREFYAKNPELRLAHIMIDLKSDAKPEEREATKKRAREIFDEVRKSKRPFEELVKLYTDDVPTKEVGGDIGFQSKVTLAPSIYEAAQKLKTGEVSGLIETKFGFHILKLLDRRSYDMADKHQIRAAVFDQKRAQIFNSYFDRTKKNYKIQVNRETLKAIKF